VPIDNSGRLAFFIAYMCLLFKVATFLPNLMKLGLKLRERHQFGQRKLNVHVIFTDKGFLQIRTTQCHICTDKGLIVFTDKVCLQISA